MYKRQYLDHLTAEQRRGMVFFRWRYPDVTLLGAVLHLKSSYICLLYTSYITGSGQVTSAAIETYEKDYYTEEGLKAFVEENLAAFNQDAASLADVYKRQVKDPFVELVKGSMNTFLNAMTYPDRCV